MFELVDAAHQVPRVAGQPLWGRLKLTLVDLHDGEVVMRGSPLALLPSAELSEAAIEDARDVPPATIDTCTTCG